MDRVCASGSGSCFESQRSFGAGKPAIGRAPVSPAKSGIDASSSGPSESARPSFQSSAGRSALPAASSNVTPSICPERPIARTFLIGSGCPCASASSVAAVARHQSSGACSDHNGCGRETRSGALASAATWSRSSTSTALMPEVPMSMPRKNAIA
jgi:hypothetical protein